jgi:hypothetical protein
MAYIGREPQIGNFQICDTITVVDAQAAYTMQVDTVDVSPESANHMIVSLNGVIQKPTDAYTVSGSTITFASALETGDVIDFIQILGNVLDLGVPSDSTVSLSKLTATGTKDATTFLRGDNTFDVPPLGGITNSQQWRISADQTGMNNGDVISNNWEVSDTTGYGGIGSAMSQSSGIFTFPSTGIWLIKFTYVGFGGDQTQDYIGATTESTTDNSTYAVANEGYNNADNNQYVVVNLNLIFDVTNTTTHKVKFSVTAQNNGIKAMGNTAKNLTNAVFTRLGDT